MLEYRVNQTFSRRAFVKYAAAAVASTPAMIAAKQPGGESSRQALLAYVGTYSAPQAPDGAGYGEGIYVFTLNPTTGALSQRSVFKQPTNPSWLAFDPAKTHLYTANETDVYEGEKSGSVSAFAVDGGSGGLTPLNTVASGGSGPCHLSVHPSGKYLFVANYAGGTVSVLQILPDGRLGKATDIKHDQGSAGPAHATSAPRGSFAISGHEAPHAHMIEADPSGRYVLAADLGLDRIFVWRFDANAGTLSPNAPDSASLPPGDGPRHFAFHHNGRWLYSLQEESSTLAFFEYEPSGGRLTAQQTLSTLPKGFAGTNFPSEVVLSADGRFVYAANRLHDTIAWFAIGRSGTLKYVDEVWTRGDYPRSFNIDPSGSFLYSCNQKSDAITVFRVDRRTGSLTFTGQYIAVGTPAIIIFR